MITILFSRGRKERKKKRHGTPLISSLLSMLCYIYLFMQVRFSIVCTSVKIPIVASLYNRVNRLFINNLDWNCRVALSTQRRIETKKKLKDVTKVNKNSN